jgi:hypothetical protein
MAAHSRKKEIEKSIVIDAPAEKVWDILTDFGNWEAWNSFIVKSEGEPVVGSTLTNTFNNKGKHMVFKPTILKVEDNRELVWRGSLMIPGLFDGTHRFSIENLSSGQVRFTNYESFSGLLSGLILGKIYDDTAANFEKMNAELKARAEGKAG